MANRIASSRKRQIIIVVALFLLLLLAFLAIYWLTKPEINKEVTVEAGSEKVDVNLFRVKDKDKVLLKDPKDLDLKKIGSYHVVLDVNGRTMDAKVNVVDTTKPQAVAQSKSCWVETVPDPKELLISYHDATELKIEYVSPPNTGAPGEQTVQIRLVDEASNEVVVDTTLLVNQVKELSLTAGSEFPDINDFLEIPVYVDITFSTDVSKINMEEPGEHQLRIRLAGAEKTTTLKITKDPRTE